jgi:hypothetical protein
MLMNSEPEVIENASETELRRLKERHRRILDYITAVILCALVATALFVVLAPKDVRIRDKPAETTRFEIVDDPTAAWARTFLTAVGGAAIAFLSKSTGGQGNLKSKGDE